MKGAEPIRRAGKQLDLDSNDRRNAEWLFVPMGHPIIAHRFNGGSANKQQAIVPPGTTQDWLRVLRRLLNRNPMNQSRSADRDTNDRGIEVPPLKRWAIVGCPKRTKTLL